MATMQGITGKLSGKMGSAVFRVREGQQVVAQYNPIVKNPNTSGQQAQRAKFKLMSQLAAIMEPAMGSFIIKTKAEGGKPTKRNAFTQINFPLVEIDTDNQEVTAKIRMDHLKLTSSFREELGEIVCSHTGGTMSIAIDLAPGSKVKSGKVVLVGYGSIGVTKRASLVTIVDVPVENNKIEYDFEGMAPGDYTVLAYGLIPSESSQLSIDLDNIHTPYDEDFMSAVQLDALVASGALVETATVGTNYTLPTY